MGPLPFEFPMIGILPSAPLELGETGTREFPTASSFTVCYEIFAAGREGMRLVDVSGRSWEVTAVRIVRRKGGKFEHIWRRLWDGGVLVELEQTFVDAPPLTFDELKAILQAQLRKHRSAYIYPGADYAPAERLKIKRARSLRDLVPTVAERALENAPVRQPDQFEQVLGDGRLDRRGLALFMAVATAIVVVLAAMPFVPHVGKLVGGAIILGAAAMSGFARRLRDLGRNPHLQWLVFVWGMPLALIHDANKSNILLDALWAGCGGRRLSRPSSGCSSGLVRPAGTDLARHHENRAGRLAPPRIRPRSLPTAEHLSPSRVRRRGGR